MTVGLSSPWVIFYREINALFQNDPDVNVVYNEDDVEIKLYVDNPEKADALMQLLPESRTFGNITAKVTVVPANKVLSAKEDLFQKAFQGNPAFNRVESIPYTENAPISYVVFAKEVVQFYTDDLGDVDGMRSTLYQDIAKDVFGDQDGIFFCTDKA